MQIWKHAFAAFILTASAFMLSACNDTKVTVASKTKSVPTQSPPVPGYEVSNPTATTTNSSFITKGKVHTFNNGSAVVNGAFTATGEVVR